MNAEDPMSMEPPPLEPASQPAPPGAAPRRDGTASRNIVIILAVVIVLALGGYLLARSGLLSRGATEEAYSVEAYTPPQPLVSARERVVAHAAPDASSPAVVMFGAGAALEVTGRVSRGLGNDWYRISWNGQTAFVRQQDTTADGEAPPGVAERPTPEREEEKKPATDEDFEAGVAEFPQPPPSSFDLSDVRWLREPSARDFARFYPVRALDQGRSGRVVLDCVASDRGSLDCSVVEENPTGWGFGDAAISIARQARIAPTAADGSSVAGRHVRLPLAFRAD